MLLSCVQTNVTFGNLSDNLRRCGHWIDHAARRQADLVVFPECMLTGYGYESREEAMEQAIRAQSPHLAELARQCAAANLHLVIGFLLLETSSGRDHLFNASALIGPAGVVAIYRKIHLPHLGVDRYVDRGSVPYTVHAAGDARIGLAICYDCSFPEPMRVLGLAGADVIALATNWPVAASRTAAIVPPARSMENHLFFIAANRIGTERGFTYCGLSSIHGPDGIELAFARHDREEILFAEVDLQAARTKRIERTPGTHVIDRFADRRPEFYVGLNEAADR